MSSHSSSAATAILKDVPWEKDPAFGSPGGDARAYLLAFRDITDRIPVKGTKIPFSSDVWNFNPYSENATRQEYRLKFTGLPIEVKDKCKFFALKRMGSGSCAISTVHQNIEAARGVLRRILDDENGPSCFNLITTEDVIESIMGRRVSNSYTGGLFTALALLYKYLTIDCGMTLLVDHEVLHERAAEYVGRAKDVREKNKTPDIPKEYYNAILSAAIKNMRDEAAPYNRRATACLLVIETQLGLRPSDLLNLRIDQLHVLTVGKNGLTAHFIHYRSQKPSKPNRPLLEFDIASNPLCTEAFKTLVKIRVQCPCSSTTNLLYVVPSNRENPSPLPISRSRLYAEYGRFIREELPDHCTLTWNGIRKRNVTFTRKRGDRVTMRISAPTFPQYRVHLCTTLYERGVPLTYIQLYMGHLSADMQGYYARPKDTYQEDIKYVEQIIHEITVDDERLLGGASADDVKARIKQLVNETGVRVEDDVEAVVRSIGDKMVVRGKPGGVCIRASLMTCAKDLRTNDILCAYSLCPNLFHMYHMADTTYMDFAVLRNTYAQALKAGKVREAEKELNKIKDLCSRKFLPELDELEREMDHKGKSYILERHPHLDEVIGNIDGIRSEVAAWMKK